MTAKEVTKLSTLTQEEQIKVLRAIAEQLYFRNGSLWSQVERLRGLEPNELLTTHDRMLNRLSVDVVLSDNGIPAHDTVALGWIESILTYNQGETTP